MKKYRGFDRIIWSVAMPGFGQILNGQIFKGVIFIFLEFLINTKSNTNMALFYSFRGDTAAAVEVLDYGWFMFYPCIYMFAIWDALKNSGANLPDYMALPYAVSAIISTIAIIFSPVLRIFGFLPGPIWLPVILGVGSGEISERLLAYHYKKEESHADGKDLSGTGSRISAASKNELDQLNALRIKDTMLNSTLKYLSEQISAFDRTGKGIKRSAVARIDFPAIGSLFEQGKANIMYYDFEDAPLSYEQTPPLKVFKGRYVKADKIKFIMGDLEKYLIVCGMPVFNNKHEVVLGVFITIDVTEVKRNIVDAKLQEEIFDMIIEYMSNPIFLVNKDGDIIGYNEVGEKINSSYFDYDNEKSLARRFERVVTYDIYGEKIPLQKVPSKRVASGETFTRIPYVYELSNMSIKYEVSGFPIYDEEDTFIFGVLCYHKISSTSKDEPETQTQKRIL